MTEERLEMLVDRIVKRLSERQQSSVEIRFEDILNDDADNENILLHYRTITVREVPTYILSLEDADNPVGIRFRQWLNKTDEYDCFISLVCAENPSGYWPYLRFLETEVPVFDKKGRRMRSFGDKNISAASVRSVPNGGCVILRKEQRLTALAEEEAQKRMICLIEGI